MAVTTPHVQSIEVVMVVSGTKYAHINPANDSATPGNTGRIEPMIPMMPHRRAIIARKVSI